MQCRAELGLLDPALVPVSQGSAAGPAGLGMLVGERSWVPGCLCFNAWEIGMRGWDGEED